VIPLIAVGLASLLLVGVTIWTLRGTRGRSRWVAIAGTLVLVGMPLNVAVCQFVLSRHGGSPVAPRDGRYFTNSHSQLTEVTEEVWHNLRTYERATWISIPVVILAGVCLFGGYIRRVQDREMEERLRGRRT
jgi:hypothetical protein